ncbi:MAG: DUF418 domain-containing protein [Bryobacteraceae bacterium]|nr:DUF418 domain-containing protein [Bryobacteraceae bacterium]
MSAALGPVRTGERISAIDTVRGFALLGILLMNIPTFGLPEAAYMDPEVWGGNDALNVWTNRLIYLFGEGKMRGIFSLVFGASVMLLLSRGEAKGGGLEPADIYFRRTLWLMLFGMIHGYLIWWGDILYPYALMALPLFAFRKASGKALIVTGSVLILLLNAGMIADAFSKKSDHSKYLKVAEAEKKGTILTAEQKSQRADWEKHVLNFQSSADKVRQEIDNYRGNYAANMKARAKSIWEFHRLPIYFPFLWDFFGMMLVGMGFFKLGIITAERSNGFYAKMAAWGLAAGLTINSVDLYFMAQNPGDPTKHFFDSAGYEVGRVAMSVGYIALLILAVKNGVLRGLTSRLAAVGQMAFSNYISHSLICSVIFYGGYGFGLIGRLERWQLYVIVLAIWTFNLTWSPIWLRHFYFGPLEWCWRSLTYWKRQPFRIRRDPPLPPAPTEALDSQANAIA